MNLKLREETKSDIHEIYVINCSAFETKAEAELVNAIREQVPNALSLVACDGNQVVGHILFSPMSMEGGEAKLIYGLAPMAVSPAYQNQGIGSKLVQAGLEKCKQRGVAAVFVLGHPNYYPKFGFVPASRYEIQSEYGVPDEVFMALELELGSLTKAHGVAKYHKVFDSI